MFRLLLRNGGKFIIGNDLEWETPLCKLLGQNKVLKFNKAKQEQDEIIGYKQNNRTNEK